MIVRGKGQLGKVIGIVMSGYTAYFIIKEYGKPEFNAIAVKDAIKLNFKERVLLWIKKALQLVKGSHPKTN